MSRQPSHEVPDDTIGELVRLRGISLSMLPAGGLGNLPPLKNNGGQSNPPRKGLFNSSSPKTLKQFIRSVLDHSRKFIDGAVPKNGTKGWPKDNFAGAFSRGKRIESYKYDRKSSGQGSDNETWFCRKSIHRNSREKGTATWEEFYRDIKQNHAATERLFDDSVFEAREAIRWEANNIQIELNDQGKVEQWNDITMSVIEMNHSVTVVDNRTFPVVLITASLEGGQEFLVVSIPLNDFDKSDYAVHAKNPKLVVGAYASIERVRVTDPGTVEWVMATTV